MARNYNPNACKRHQDLYCNQCGLDDVYGCREQETAYSSLEAEATRPINPGARAVLPTWTVNYLASNRVNQASHYDENLINPWGIVISQDQLWVACGGSDKIVNYDMYGARLLGAISVRDAANNSSFPTGIAVNCGGGFVVDNGVYSKSSTVLTCTEHGTLHGYNPEVDNMRSYVILNTQKTGRVDVFKGFTMLNGLVYLANFFQKTIDVYTSNYVKLNGFHFQDGDTVIPIPIDYGPVNIVYMGCYLYVLWARQNPNLSVYNVDGPGSGYISVFRPDGSFVKRFHSNGHLNSPWAMIPSPVDCGFPPGSFIVANHGDGQINIFDCSGRYVGPVLGQDGGPLYIIGVRGLFPDYRDINKIYFTSSTDENHTGVVGCLKITDYIQFAAR